ncbi:hypothetical protein VTJ04DRAFT_6704 [Mycothermus thermophilus]|uniref:uncharacterized protein n=1 Tax=Humicola insolens TaxID=85995 RepID=UPI003742A7F4
MIPHFRRRQNSIRPTRDLAQFDNCKPCRRRDRLVSFLRLFLNHQHCIGVHGYGNGLRGHMAVLFLRRPPKCPCWDFDFFLFSPDDKGTTKRTEPGYCSGEKTVRGSSNTFSALSRFHLPRTLLNWGLATGTFAPVGFSQADIRMETESTRETPGGVNITHNNRKDTLRYEACFTHSTWRERRVGRAWCYVVSLMTIMSVMLGSETHNPLFSTCCCR